MWFFLKKKQPTFKNKKGQLAFLLFGVGYIIEWKDCELRQTEV